MLHSKGKRDRRKKSKNLLKLNITRTIGDPSGKYLQGYKFSKRLLVYYDFYYLSRQEKQENMVW